MKLFPWDNSENKPFFVNELENEWWVDKHTTEYANYDSKGNPSLNAVCFYVVENKNNNRKILTRILISKDDNSILAEERNLEAMGTKIDILKYLKSFDDN